VVVVVMVMDPVGHRRPHNAGREGKEERRRWAWAHGARPDMVACEEAKVDGIGTVVGWLVKLVI